MPQKPFTRDWYKNWPSVKAKSHILEYLTKTSHIGKLVRVYIEATGHGFFQYHHTISPWAGIASYYFHQRMYVPTTTHDFSTIITLHKSEIKTCLY
jgi:hypothetical protein